MIADCQLPIANYKPSLSGMGLLHQRSQPAINRLVIGNRQLAIGNSPFDTPPVGTYDSSRQYLVTRGGKEPFCDEFCKCQNSHG